MSNTIVLNEAQAAAIAKLQKAVTDSVTGGVSVTQQTVQNSEGTKTSGAETMKTYRELTQLGLCKRSTPYGGRSGNKYSRQTWTTATFRITEKGKAIAV